MKLTYNPETVPENYPEDKLVILHDGVPIPTVVDTDEKTLEGEIAHFSDVVGGLGTKLVYQGMVQDAPKTVACGERLTVIWNLQNQSGANAVDFRLVESGNSSYSDGQTNYPKFTINSWETGQAAVENFPVPQEPGYHKIYFNILDTNGDTLPYLDLGTLWIEFTVEECQAQPPSKPILESPGNGSSGQPNSLTLDWKPVEGATVYRLFVAYNDDVLSSLSNKDKECAGCIVNTTTSSDSYGVDLEDGTYYWMVRAGNAEGGSPNSEIWSFTIKDPAQTATTTTTITGQTSTTVTGQTTTTTVAPTTTTTTTIPPASLTYYKINDDAPSTDTCEVTLNNIAGGNPTHYKASESDEDFDDADWISYSEAPTFRLSPPNEEEPNKTVYFKVKSEGGESSRLSDSIRYLPKIKIEYMDVWQDGHGKTVVDVRISASNPKDLNVELIFNGESKPMKPDDNDETLFRAKAEKFKPIGKSTYKAIVKDDCGASASIGPIEVPASWSGIYGDDVFKGGNVCGKRNPSGTEGDPINTTNGNFINGNIDGVVAGVGGTTLALNRTYNSLAALWTPASIMRYTQDEDSGEVSEEKIAGPYEHFGTAWAFPYGEFLLEVDKPPYFEGVHIMLSDGRTILFRDNGDDTYSSESPLNTDILTREGEEYVLRRTCCTSEEKRYNTAGQLTAVSDRNGNTITFTYNGDQLTRVENASGRGMEFIYDSDGHIAQVSMPEGVTTKYEYTDDLLTAFINGREKRTEYRYDKNDEMTELITPKGHHALRLTYDSENWYAVEQTEGETEKRTLEYNEDISLVTITDAYNNKTVHHYDDKGRLVQLDYPDGSTELYDYDDDYNRTYYKDQEGAEWHWTYDDRGNRLTADGPLGWHREWQYNDLNRVTRMAENVDADTLRETTFEYDDRGNMTKVCVPMGDCGTVTYDTRGLPTEVYDLAGNHNTHTYDAEGDLIAVKDAEDATTRFDHDGLGRVTRMTKPLGNVYEYTYDPNSNLTAVNGPLGFELSFGFDDNDNLNLRTDPNGGNIRYSHDASDRLVSVKNQLNFDAADYAYGLMNELTGFTDAEGRSWTYAYDNLLRVIQIRGPLDTTFSYAYNAVGRITDFTDANGMITHTDYDALYRPASVIRNYRPGESPDSDTNVTVTYSYNLAGNLLGLTDPENYDTSYEYDLRGRRILRRDAEGHEWEYAYDPMGNLTSVLNPRGFSTTFEYTPGYRLSRVISPEEHAAVYRYNDNGRLTDKTDPKGVVTHYDYNELDRMIRRIRNYKLDVPGDAETNVTSEYSYDPAGNLRSLTNPLAHHAELVYDAAHRRTRITDFEAGATVFAYDRVNNLLAVTDAEGNATAYTYDDLNRLIAATNAENETTGFGYDPMGNRIRLTEADDTVTIYGYDAVYRLNRVTQNYQEGVLPSNDTNVLTQYAYNPRGLLTRITDANGSLTTFDYNAVGRMIRETNPLGDVWDYAYDGVGNRIARTDANRARTDYAYYPDNLLREITYADGASVNYAYDHNNNRTEMQDSLGTTAWDYDPLNRVIRADDPFDRGIDYSYDAAGNRTGMVYPDGNQVAYAYSPNNWLKTVTTPEDLSTHYQRDKVGNITHIANPNFTETDLSYDKVYRVLSLETRQILDKIKTISGFDYTYNAVGHVTQTVKEYGWRQPSVVTESYAYDGLHRLAGVEIDPIKNNGEKAFMSYAYDPVGNRLEWTTTKDLTTNIMSADGFTKSYTYNAANQLLTMVKDSDMPNGDLRTDFTYDANGSRINKLESDENGPLYGVDYTFDPENRLVEALDYQLVGYDHFNRIDRAVTTLAYDGGGRRMVKTYDPKSNDAQGVKKRAEYVFDGLDPVAEYYMLNGQRTDFYRGAGGRIITMHHYKAGTHGQMYWYHYNFKGDVAGLTKHNGNSHHNYRYDPYGGVLPENGNFTDPHNHYTLTGKEYDENMGLVWFGARHYDKDAGVWLTQDLYRGVLDNPASLHRYMYVDDNPLSYLDPWGFWKMAAKDGHLVAIAEKGDYLSDLAYKLTGSGNNYTAIFDANKDRLGLTHPSAIETGQHFAIPDITPELIFMNHWLAEQNNTYNPLIHACKATDKQVGTLCSKDFSRYGFGDVDECKEAVCGGKHNRQPNNCWGTSLSIALGTLDIYAGSGGLSRYESPDKLLSYFKKVDIPQFGDIVRYADDSKGIHNTSKSDYLTHYATFLIESKEGDRYVFSKSGYKGKYEVVKEQDLETPYKDDGYGLIEGYYHKIKDRPYDEKLTDLMCYFLFSLNPNWEKSTDSCKSP
ncbi:YD repeat-containing protein [Desulfonema magnum]|uniref:YD repeat-containing protein n=1 Tax=Desulfonema magnum TaxID=45655 RepID=A0A975BKW5_9BACT|nr:YD repeat-containing protein [Desulfonema magnum]